MVALLLSLATPTTWGQHTKKFPPRFLGFSKSSSMDGGGGPGDARKSARFAPEEELVVKVSRWSLFHSAGFLHVDRENRIRRVDRCGMGTPTGRCCGSFRQVLGPLQTPECPAASEACPDEEDQQRRGGGKDAGNLICGP